ncbi:MAG: Asp-tRNA(Asn)/Glu-tRNA(Gln) amidotransferase subunit GatC [Deltaproteobacteria bacterium]|nr:Asp-tRNA(Asn)/Glu-tRNA(Gln) amidotransferase subunit GatC [Deltaproteobacteria bacterium]MBW2368019.1 Asp-tRNA(Asn)/Glu-tRNA(Gln) amidotransferase subunit GatC [Deltaproteobacteria bacterium]
MTISKKDVTYVANLAHLTLEESDLDTFAQQIGTILEYVNTLNQVDTTGVAATSHAIFLNNAFREDDPKPHLGQDKSLANAPEDENGHFIVPKIIG